VFLALFVARADEMVDADLRRFLGVAVDATVPQLHPVRSGTASSSTQSATAIATSAACACQNSTLAKAM